MKDYYVYILANRSGTLYVGVTNDLMQRVKEHKDGVFEGFTKRYGINRLMYFEAGNDVEGAILRENRSRAGFESEKLS